MNFYVDLVQDYGEPGAATSGFSECVTRYAQGQAAMWYDATSMVSTIESEADSTVVGKNAYAPAPVVKTDMSGWLYSWSLGIPETTDNPDEAWEFVSWMTYKDYIRLVGEELGWARVPPGSRLSTYEIPQYAKQAKAYAQPTLTAMKTVDPEHPTVDPVPYTGIQFVGIPEFQDLGTRVSQQISAAIAGQTDGRGGPGAVPGLRRGRRRLVPGGLMATTTAPSDGPARGHLADPPRRRSSRGGPAVRRCCPRSSSPSQSPRHPSS